MKRNPAPPHERAAFTYTTAPEDYDWSWSKTVRVVGTDKRGRPIRLVSTEKSRVEAQRDRYASGLHMAVDDTEWEKLVKYDLVKTYQDNPPIALGPVPDSLMWLSAIASIAALWLTWDVARKQAKEKKA